MSGSQDTPAQVQVAARDGQIVLREVSVCDGAEPRGNEEGLEPEQSSLIRACQMTGGKEGGAGPGHIELLAALCMKELDEEEEEEEEEEEGDDDEDLETDADLLAELKEVLQQNGEETSAVQTQPNALPHPMPVAPIGSSALEFHLIGRMDMYHTAIRNAMAIGPTGRMRRYERGLKTLQSMLASVRMGKPIHEEEIPPPVSTGSTPTAHQTSQPIMEQEQSNLQPGTKEILNKEATLMALSRQKEYKLAAVQAKQTGDLELAKRYYLTAKKLDFIVEEAKRGEFEDTGPLLPPPPPPGPGSEDEAHVLPHTVSIGEEEHPADATTTVPSVLGREGERTPAHPHSAPLSLEAGDQYTQLMELLRRQQERCLEYCQQFSHMGNITETAKFEMLAEECVQHIEVLKEAQGRGYPMPKFHTEERTINTFKIVPELTGSDLVLAIVKGINLPSLAGLSPNDVDTSVRFEFLFPSLEEAQRDQTRSVKNSTCPEFNEHFKLHIKRGHRGFKRVIQSKGIKFEILQKGGLFKADRVVGSAQLKLDSLENQCEVSELIEVLNRRKATGGHLEVQVKIREPLAGPQPHMVTERWLVLDPLTIPLVATPKAKPQDNPLKNVSTRSTLCSVL